MRNRCGVEASICSNLPNQFTPVTCHVAVGLKSSAICCPSMLESSANAASVYGRCSNNVSAPASIENSPTKTAHAIPVFITRILKRRLLPTNRIWARTHLTILRQRRQLRLLPENLRDSHNFHQLVKRRRLFEIT